MKLDILLPLYAPHDGWEKNIIDALTMVRQQLPPSVELTLYITNDGADDTYYSPEALTQLSNAVNGRFHFLKHKKNRGKGFSLRHLVKHSAGDFIVYTDGDFPFGWESVTKAFNSLTEGSDIVMGRRNQSYAAALSPFRKILSAGVHFLNNLICGLPEELQDTQTGLKGFNHRGREIFLQTTVDSFMFDTEFILLAWYQKLRITPLDVQLRPHLKLSSMGFKVLFRELLCFAKIFWRIRIKKCYQNE